MISQEDHLYLLLAEEAAEVSQRVSKLIRFGKDELHEEFDVPNHELLAQELDDLLAVAELLREKGALRDPDLERISAKKRKVFKYTVYSQSLGRVEG